MRAPILIVSLGIALAAGAAGGISRYADAATSQNINTNGVTCNPYNASQALDIDYFTFGVRTIAATTRPVVCSIERHPVTGPGQSFFIDGSNSGGATTSCSIQSYSFTGVFQSSNSFSSNLATYDQFLSLSLVNFFDYVSLFCNLPGAGAGVLFGVTALDN